MSAENIVNTGAQVSPENIALMANRQTQTRTAHGRAEAREEARVHSEMLGRGSGRGSGAWGVRPVPGSREKPRVLAPCHLRARLFPLPPEFCCPPAASISARADGLPGHQAPSLANLDQELPTCPAPRLSGARGGLAGALALNSVSRGPLRSEGRLCARPGRRVLAAPGAEHPGAESRAGRGQPQGRLPCEDGRTNRRCQGGGPSWRAAVELACAPGTEAGDAGMEAGLGSSRVMPELLLGALSPARGDGLSGGRRGHRTRGRTQGEQGQIWELRRSLSPRPLMCDGRTGMGGALVCRLGGTPHPSGRAPTPWARQLQSQAPTGHPAPLGKFLICTETQFLVHKVRTRCSQW